MGRKGRVRALGTLGILIMATVGCTSGQEVERPPTAATGEAGDKRQVFDPPRTFDVSAPVPLPDSASDQKISSVDGELFPPLPVLLDKTRVWIASVDKLEIVDIDHGTVTATLGPTYEPMERSSVFPDLNAAEPPVLADAGGRRQVVTAFATTVAGEGTTPPRPVVEILAVDADSGRETQRIEIEPSEWELNAHVQLRPFVIGAHGPVVVVQIGGETAAVDLEGQREIWRRADFTLGDVAGDVVVGTDSEATVARALDIGSGAERWHTDRAEKITIKPGSPKVVTATVKQEGKAFFRLLDAVSGRVLDESSADLSGYFSGYRITCIHDESVTVCHDRHLKWVGAFDDSGKWLWELPDKKANRIAPTVTTAWHGAVYGRTSSGPVVLDARTGADVETAPGVAPWLVNEYVAIASPPENYAERSAGDPPNYDLRLYLYPATG